MAPNLEETNKFVSKVVVSNAGGKYGSGNRGVFASQNIQQGDIFFMCDPSNCDYIFGENRDTLKTKVDFFKCCDEYPECKEFILRYQCMIDHDTYTLPKKWKELKLLCTCAFFNHSCEPNCGFKGNSCYVSLKDISAGEELTFDYQFLDTEASLYNGLNCKCGSINCRGILTFEQYRKPEWQAIFYKYCTDYVKDQIDSLKTKWFSSKCYIKRFEPSQKGLVALQSIEKDSLVATFFNDVKSESHYLRSNANPTCYMIDKSVYTAKEITPDEELTLDYPSLLPLQAQTV